MEKIKTITSEKEVIKKFEEGLKLELSRGEYKRRYYYMTDYKNIEITVAKHVIRKMIDKGLVCGTNETYLPHWNKQITALDELKKSE